MSQQRQYNDTTFTKIFVGGLAWETQRDTMSRYFEQFGDILEAVVIIDKNTGRSKGYGFVTFKDPDAAMRACQNPSPVIDGRRANCNIASLGAQKTRQPTLQHGVGRFHHGSSSTYVQQQQPTGQYLIPYSAYGYTGYSQDDIYPLSYYNIYGGQHFSPYYYPTGESMTPRMFHNLYPFYPQMVQQYPYLPQQIRPTGIIPLPPSSSMPTTSATIATAAAAEGATTASATKTTTTTTSVETMKITPPPPPTTTRTITIEVVGEEPGPSQVSETPTEKKPSS